MEIAKYLGQPASCLIQADHFKHWSIERSVDDESDSPEVRYSFTDRGLRFNCDRHNELINCLFLESEKDGNTVLSEVSFTLGRNEVLKYFGSPSKSGEGFSHPVLGNFGPWDRFKGSTYTVHIQYKSDSAGIQKITLMRADVVP